VGIGIFLYAKLTLEIGLLFNINEVTRIRYWDIVYFVVVATGLLIIVKYSK